MLFQMYKKSVKDNAVTARSICTLKFSFFFKTEKNNTNSSDDFPKIQKMMI